MQTNTHLDSRAHSLPSNPVGYTCRPRACVCMFARSARNGSVASHARRLAAAPIAGGAITAHARRMVWQSYPVGPPGGTQTAPTHADRESQTVGDGGPGHHRESARLHTNAAAGLVDASAAYPRRDREALSINARGIEAIRPVSCASSTGEGGHTRAQKRQAPEPANSASSTALVVRVLLRTATPHLREFEACLSAGVAGSTRLEKTREQSQARASEKERLRVPTAAGASGAGQGVQRPRVAGQVRGNGCT